MIFQSYFLQQNRLGQNMQKIHRVNSRQVWRCSKCQFDNSILLDNCQICQQNKPAKHESKQKDLNIIKQETSSSIMKSEFLVCYDPECKVQNAITQILCKKCGKFLVKQLNEEDSEEQYEKSQQKKDKQKVQMTHCNKCKFYNDPSNVTCVNCQTRLKKKRAPRKPRSAAYKVARHKGPYFCQSCNSYKRYTSTTQFQCNCPDPDDGIPVQKNICNYCFLSLPIGKYDEHVESCKQRQIFYDRKRNKSHERCTDLQIQTMIYMHKKCQKLHFGKQKKLQSRVEKLGYTKKDLEHLYHYIVNYAPIIIHMHANTHMQFFVKDTHYRSQFETSKSSGSLSRTARTGWQDRMFDNKHHNAKDFQRVKYGTMNFTNDPHGVAVCTSYGQSYFLLKQHVRDRCTMTDMDSSSSNSTICTFRFCFHLLCKLSDNQIKAAFQGSKAKQVKSAGIIGAYKQIQIHGPVQFKKDVERVYISRAQVATNPKCIKQVEQFCKNHGLDYQLFGQEKPAGAIRPFGGEIFGGGMIDPSGGLFAPRSVPGFGYGFGSSSFFSSAPSMFPAYKPPPIKYTAVSFPYSSKKDQQDQFSDEDYI